MVECWLPVTNYVYLCWSGIVCIYDQLNFSCVLWLSLGLRTTNSSTVHRYIYLA